MQNNILPKDFYSEYQKRLAAVRLQLNRPLTLAEKIVYVHLFDVKELKSYDRGSDYAYFAPDRVAMSKFSILQLQGHDIMNILARSVMIMYTFDDDADITSRENLMKQAVSLIAKFPTIIAYAYHSMLEQGKPMLFGKENEKGLALDGFNLKVVTLGENGITEKDILVHDATTEDNTLHLKLANMTGPDFPVAMGVIRNVETSTYNDELVQQIEDVQSKSKIKTFDDLLKSLDSW